MSFSLLSTVWEHLASAWTRATDLAARLATRLASHIARVLKPALVALLIGACQDKAIARLIARELEPVRKDIAYASNRMRDLENTVFEHSERSNVIDNEHLDTQNQLLKMLSRIGNESYANECALEILQLELESAKTEIAKLKRVSSPRTKPITQTRSTSKTTTVVLDANAPVALCHQAKAKPTLRQPVRWRA